MDFPTEKNPISDIELITCSVCGKPTEVYQFIKKKTVLSVPTTLSDAAKTLDFSKISNPLGSEGTKKRYCSVECVNFDKPSCSANNWQSLNQKSEIPFKCQGYKSPNPGEVS
jgi:hypothetical protein